MYHIIIINYLLVKTLFKYTSFQSMKEGQKLIFIWQRPKTYLTSRYFVESRKEEKLEWYENYDTGSKSHFPISFLKIMVNLHLWQRRRKCRLTKTLINGKMHSKAFRINCQIAIWMCRKLCHIKITLILWANMKQTKDYSSVTDLKTIL